MDLGDIVRKHLGEEKSQISIVVIDFDIPLTEEGRGHLAMVLDYMYESGKKQMDINGPNYCGRIEYQGPDVFLGHVGIIYNGDLAIEGKGMSKIKVLVDDRRKTGLN